MWPEWLASPPLNEQRLSGGWDLEDELVQQLGRCVQQALQHVEGSIVIHRVTLQDGCRGARLLQDSRAHPQGHRIVHWGAGTGIRPRAARKAPAGVPLRPANLPPSSVPAAPLRPSTPPLCPTGSPHGPSQTRVTIQPEAIHVLVDEGRVPHEDIQLVGHGDARTREQPQRPGRSEYCPGGRAADGPLPGAPRFRSPHPEPPKDHFRDKEGGAGAAREEAEAGAQRPLSAGRGVPGARVPTATPPPARPGSPTLEPFPVTSSVPPPRGLCSFQILTGLYPRCGSFPGLNPSLFVCFFCE